MQDAPCFFELKAQCWSACLLCLLNSTVCRMLAGPKPELPFLLLIAIFDHRGTLEILDGSEMVMKFWSLEEENLAQAGPSPKSFRIGRFR